MKIGFTKLAALLVANALCLAAASSQASTIAAWSFDAGGTIAAPYNTPAATTGTGSATQLGMSNSYTYANGEGPGSAANCDVLASAGASTGSGSFGWRVRGNGNSANTGAGVANGWNSQAPIGTQGAEFSVNTTGFTSITISADINATGQAERNLAILYTLDNSVANPVWQNATITSSGTGATLLNNSSSALTVNGNYLQLSGTGTGWNNQITASLPLAGQDPNFAVEIVNASTGTDCVNTSGAALNNSSRNWRYDNITISGTAVPEPSTIALMTFGAAGFAVSLRRRRSR
jgi:hypothetical protein